VGESQCLDGVLNEYREKCFELLGKLDKFSMSHVTREDNARANTLAQQASRYDVICGRFEVKRRPTSFDVMHGDVSESVSGDAARG
jgi:hypothetical protein